MLPIFLTDLIGIVLAQCSDNLRNQVLDYTLNTIGSSWIAVVINEAKSYIPAYSLIYVIAYDADNVHIDYAYNSDYIHKPFFTDYKQPW